LDVKNFKTATDCTACQSRNQNWTQITQIKLFYYTLKPFIRNTFTLNATGIACRLAINVMMGDPTSFNHKAHEGHEEM